MRMKRRRHIPNTSKGQGGWGWAADQLWGAEGICEMKTISLGFRAWGPREWGGC